MERLGRRISTRRDRKTESESCRGRCKFSANLAPCHRPTSLPADFRLQAPLSTPKYHYCTVPSHAERSHHTLVVTQHSQSTLKTPNPPLALRLSGSGRAEARGRRGAPRGRPLQRTTRDCRGPAQTDQPGTVQGEIDRLLAILDRKENSEVACHQNVCMLVDPTTISYVDPPWSPASSDGEPWRNALRLSRLSR